jgi:hypothetical protein
MDLAQERFETAAAAMGCLSNATRSGDMLNDEVMDCLSNAPLEALIEGINSVAPNGFAPQVELEESNTFPALAEADPGTLPGSGMDPKAFLPALPSHLLHTGRFSHGVQLIGGHTTHDGRTFANGKPEEFISGDDIRRVVFGKRWPRISNETITKGLKLYPPSAFGTVYDRAWHVAGDVVFTCMYVARQGIPGVSNGTLSLLS